MSRDVNKMHKGQGRHCCLDCDNNKVLVVLEISRNCKMLFIWSKSTSATLASWPTHQGRTWPFHSDLSSFVVISECRVSKKDAGARKLRITCSFASIANLDRITGADRWLVSTCPATWCFLACKPYLSEAQ